MSKIKFDFKPDDKTLNPHYIKLEHCINGMNASNNRSEIDKLCQQAVDEVLTIADFNINVIDMMGECKPVRPDQSSCRDLRR